MRFASPRAQLTIILGEADIGGFALKVNLEVSGLGDDADKLIKMADEACPYSRAYEKGAVVEAKAA